MIKILRYLTIIYLWSLNEFVTNIIWNDGHCTNNKINCKMFRMWRISLIINYSKMWYTFSFIIQRVVTHFWMKWKIYILIKLLSHEFVFDINVSIFSVLSVTFTCLWKTHFQYKISLIRKWHLRVKFSLSCKNIAKCYT